MIHGSSLFPLCDGDRNDIAIQISVSEHLIDCEWTQKLPETRPYRNSLDEVACIEYSGQMAS